MAAEVPKVVGSGYSELLSKSSHAKTHFFDFKNGMPVISSGENTPSGSRMATAKVTLPRSSTSNGQALDLSDVKSGSPGPHSGGFTPAFAALDRKVLRFSAWFTADGENPYESGQVHHVSILYYLVDDSLQISEPKTLNAGMPQGTYLKRHRVPRGDSWVSWQDLRVGESITLYGREFHVSDCDAFTQQFYESNDQKQPASIKAPLDEYTEMRRDMVKAPNRLHRFIDWNLRKKLNNPFAKKCLRFFACWDDRDNTFGEKRPFVVNFFLEDETMEVLEVHSPNDGRQSFPRMLKRQKFPKVFDDLADMYGQHLTVIDLKVGHYVNIFGRQFYLYACDDSTKKFLIENYDYKEEDFPDLVDEVLEPDVPLPTMPTPPHTGIGTPEDSLQSVKHLVPRPPRRDLAKLLKFEGKVIRWQAKLVSDVKEDEDRRFIISFNLADDTMSIFEPPIKNSGIMGGSFMAREKVWKPNKKFEAAYGLDDFQPGGVIMAHGHSFELLMCDDFTTKLVEQIHNQVAEVDTGHILTPDEAMNMLKQKLSTRNKRAFWQFARIVDKDHSGSISMDEMWEACKLFNIDISRENMEQWMGHFDKDNNGEIDYREMAQFMGEELY